MFVENRAFNNLLDRFATAGSRTFVRKVGVEIERIGVWNDSKPVSYSSGERPGVEWLLKEFSRKWGWKLVHNGRGNVIGLNGEQGKVTLEPGSQVEFASEPFSDLLLVKSQVAAFENQMSSISYPFNINWIDVGVNPFSDVSDIELIPMKRYELMIDYLSQRGSLGTSMMKLTSSIQINVDYTDAGEAIDMLQVALLCAPVSYALFSNSPFFKGRPSGLLSTRGYIWRHTDSDRTGLLKQAFTTPDFELSDYIDLLMRRPLMFVENRWGEFVSADGLSLWDISTGRLSDVEASDQNQMHAVRELFFEARLKPGYVEIRSLDNLPGAQRWAAIAFWTGLLVSSDARACARDLLGHLNFSELDDLFRRAIQMGLQTTLHDVDLYQVAVKLVEASRRSLVSRGLNEELLLDVLSEQSLDKKNPSQRWVEQPGGVSIHDTISHVSSETSQGII